MTSLCVSPHAAFASLCDSVLADARRLGQADGVTFVLRDGPYCFYVAEDTIAPLWTGQRFPLEECITGWAMLHDDIAQVPFPYRDPRIPHSAYRPTFVKSLLALPMGAPALGALGLYWSQPGHIVSVNRLARLIRLADEAARSLADLDLADAPWAPNFSLPTAARPVPSPG